MTRSKKSIYMQLYEIALDSNMNTTKVMGESGLALLYSKLVTQTKIWKCTYPHARHGKLCTKQYYSLSPFHKSQM